MASILGRCNNKFIAPLRTFANPNNQNPLSYFIHQNDIKKDNAYPPKQSIHHFQQEEQGAITFSFTPRKKLITKWH
jgi:hypothetical protein